MMLTLDPESDITVIHLPQIWTLNDGCLASRLLTLCTLIEKVFSSSLEVLLPRAFTFRCNFRCTFCDFLVRSLPRHTDRKCSTFPHLWHSFWYAGHAVHPSLCGCCPPQQLHFVEKVSFLGGFSYCGAPCLFWDLGLGVALPVFLCLLRLLLPAFRCFLLEHLLVLGFCHNLVVAVRWLLVRWGLYGLTLTRNSAKLFVTWFHDLHFEILMFQISASILCNMTKLIHLSLVETGILRRQCLSWARNRLLKRRLLCLKHPRPVLIRW